MQAGVKRFREQYRNSITKYYNPILHLGFVLACGLLLIVTSSKAVIVNANSVLSGICGVLIFVVAEYYIHRQLGHKKNSFAKLFYQRHTQDHHHFFNHNAMSIEFLKDWRVTLFPAWLIIVVICLALIGGRLGQVFGLHAHALTMGVVAGYLLYELMHLCFHLPEEHFLTRLPGIKTMRRHHQIHHDPENMHKYNFNLTIPVVDFLNKTSKK